MMVFKRVLGIALILSFVAAGCSPDDPRRKTKAGLGTGAVIGGVIGGVIDKNHERGIAIGTVLGATLGGLIGYAWDRYDQQRLVKTLETVPSGRSVKWVNPDTDIQWTATPQPARRGHQGRPVRKVTIEGKDQRGNRRIKTIEAQRNAGGNWVAL